MNTKPHPKGIGVWNKGRNQRESTTLARVLDLQMMENGVGWAVRDSGIEVLLRRLHAIRMADDSGEWPLAHGLEEIPGPGKPHLHPNILRNLYTQEKLLQQVETANKGTAGAKQENDGD